MFERRPLRDDVQREIRRRIVDGRLPAGGRLNESHLAVDLGISRTPLREAMLGLEAAGFLSSLMGRGFRVPELDPTEFRDLAAVQAHLVPLALEISPDPSPKRLMELQNALGRARVGAGREGPDAAMAAASLLTEWTGRSLDGCPNIVLKEDALRIEALEARYWHAAVSNGFPAEAIVAYVERLYEMQHGRRRAEAAAFVNDSLYALADQAAAVLA